MNIAASKLPLRKLDCCCRCSVNTPSEPQSNSIRRLLDSFYPNLVPFWKIFSSLLCTAWHRPQRDGGRVSLWRRGRSEEQNVTFHFRKTKTRN